MKTKARAAIAAAVILLLLSACEKQKETEDEKIPVTPIGVESGQYYDDYWNDTAQQIMASVNYPYIHLCDGDKEVYFQLEKSLSELSKERKEGCLELYSQAIDASEDFFAQGIEYVYSFDVWEKTMVRRADSRVLSLLLEGYYYVGGAHGAPYSLGVTFDSQTGEQLKLTDVVVDMEQLPILVEEQLELFWDSDYFYENLNLIDFFQENLENIQWVLDYHGITFYFNPYDIAPYASGSQNVTISFREHPQLFREEYLETPGSYGIELPQDKPFHFDIDGDGNTDTLLISAARGGEDYYEPQTIWLNDTRYEEDTGVYLIEPSLMHTKEGKNYLYIGEQYPDDLWIYTIYDISSGTVEKVDTVYSGRHSVIQKEQEYYARQVLTNAESFFLDTYIQMLGTGYGYDTYHIGEKGLPVKEHDWYLIGNETEFTIQKDFSLTVVDEEGNRIGETRLKEGDKVIYYRTDAKTWADLILPDGGIGRVFPQQTEEYWTVDGINVEELFEGIIFGG
ncbi:MAG: DUF3298 domain-containing protein [Lachnospiraceae bacterium]